VLGNHAGIALDRGMPPSAVPAAGLRRTSETTVWGPVAGIHACLPLLKRSAAGRMVHVSSAWGTRAQQSYPACECRHITRLADHASQTALHAVTMPFAQALQDTRLPATAAAPGDTATDGNTPRGTQTVAPGAQALVRLTTCESDGPLPW
jgi:NAD(P)-dependent dehydrogenase (short-subunit alcohol dehydrogenase family)